MDILRPWLGVALFVGTIPVGIIATKSATHSQRVKIKRDLRNCRRRLTMNGAWELFADIFRSNPRDLISVWQRQNLVNSLESLGILNCSD